MMNQSAVGKLPQSTTIEANGGPVPNLPEHSADLRQGRELLLATRPFANGITTQSWWYVSSTFALMIGTLAGAGIAGGWPMRTALAILGGLLMVRAFITYHDFMHGAILRDSRLASWIFHLYGAIALTPASSWKESHNYRHGHVGQISFTSMGAAIPEVRSPLTTSLTPREIVNCFHSCLWDEDRQRMVSYAETGPSSDSRRRHSR